MSLYLTYKLPSDVQDAFEARVIQMAANLGMTDPSAPDWLMAIMDNESGLSSSIVNSIGCVGLIQFCPDSPGGATKTIGGQQYNLADIAAMDPVSQLNVVEQYLSQYIHQYGQPQTFADLYMLVFMPAAEHFGQSDPISVGSASYMDTVKRENPMFVDSNGNITKDSIQAVYARKYAGLASAVEEVAKETVETVKSVIAPQASDTSFVAVVGSVFLVIGGALLFFWQHRQQQIAAA